MTEVYLLLNVILLDCALELVPSEISSSKEIQKHASKRKKKPTELLLDQSVHGRSMTKLPDAQRRGRPDITYLSLLTLLETPLCKEKQMKVFLHLQDGRIVSIDPDVRLPRSYDRFVGLVEQLLLQERVPASGPPLLQVTRKSLSDIVHSLAPPEGTFLAIEGGERTTLANLERYMVSTSEVTMGVGAFPHGDFSEEIKNLFGQHLELDKDVMMAWHICAAVVWAYSKGAEIISKRYAS